MWSEFRAFLFKSNALALAIGVIIGAALGAVVDSLVKDIIMPPVGLLLGGIDFANQKIVLKAATGGDPATEVAIRYGNFINLVIAFVVVAFIVFMIARTFIKEAPKEPEPKMRTCPYCRDLVPADATKCRSCTSELAPVAG
jgi:large conductance mechanosensitive channel